MSIYISASAIKDFLSCSMKLYYRTHLPELSVSTNAMQTGIVVHYALENFWNEKDSAFHYIESNLYGGQLEKATMSLHTFFDSFSWILTDEDEIEKKFKIPLGNNVYLIGKIDRISGANIYDWKTTAKPPKSINNDIQFMIYYIAYIGLYGIQPSSVCYASLSNGNLIKLKVNDEAVSILQKEIIPKTVSALIDNNYAREGVFRGNTCYNCTYKEACLGGAE